MNDDDKTCLGFVIGGGVFVLVVAGVLLGVLADLTGNEDVKRYTGQLVGLVCCCGPFLLLLAVVCFYVVSRGRH
jgi:hypothetical protein